MIWAVELSAAAEKDLKRLPRDRQARIERAIDELEENPFAGDVKALQGPEWKGRYRKRVWTVQDCLYGRSQSFGGGGVRHSHPVGEDLPISD